MQLGTPWNPTSQVSPAVKNLRLTIYAILNQDKHALTLFAPDCGSWGLPARSTSQRSYINPWGNEGYSFVQRGNCMVSRILQCTFWKLHEPCMLLCQDYVVSKFWVPKKPLVWLPRMVLLILLILSRNGFWLVEQPSQSLLYMHKRWQWLANRVAWVPCWTQKVSKLIFNQCHDLFPNDISVKLRCFKYSSGCSCTDQEAPKEACSWETSWRWAFLTRESLLRRNARSAQRLRLHVTCLTCVPKAWMSIWLKSESPSYSSICSPAI